MFFFHIISYDSKFSNLFIEIIINSTFKGQCRTTEEITIHPWHKEAGWCLGWDQYADHEFRLLSVISFPFLANICCLSYYASLPKSYCARSKTCDLCVTRQCTTCSLFFQAGKGHKSSQAIFNYLLSLRVRLHLFENQKQIKVRQRHWDRDTAGN